MLLALLLSVSALLLAFLVLWRRQSSARFAPLEKAGENAHIFRPRRFRARDFSDETQDDESQDNNSNEFDAIVIGSGMSGLTCASLLAQFDRAKFNRIAVLEQHASPGGCLHTFSTGGGAGFETGIHYVGSGYGCPAPPGGVAVTNVESMSAGRLMSIAMGEPLDPEARRARAEREEEAEEESLSRSSQSHTGASAAAAAAAAGRHGMLADPACLQRFQRLPEVFDITSLKAEPGVPGQSATAGASLAKEHGLDASWRTFRVGPGHFDDLVAQFADERDHLREFQRRQARAADSSIAMVAAQVFPFLRTPWLSPLLRRVWPAWRDFEHFGPKATSQVLDECQIRDPLLRRRLCYLYGDYGALPEQSSFVLHAATDVHYERGAFFPAGGSDAMASRLVGAIQASGGEVFTQARCLEITTRPTSDSSGGGGGGKHRVTGVKVVEQHAVQAGRGAPPKFDSSGSAEPKKSVFLRSPVVISTAGVHATYRHLLKQEVREGPPLKDVVSLLSAQSPLATPERELPAFGVSGVFLQMFVALDPAAPVDAANRWIYYDSSRDFAESASVPLRGVYMAFPCAKDPDYARRHPSRKSFVLIGEMDYEPWEKFARAHGVWRHYPPYGEQPNEADIDPALRKEFEAMKDEIQRDLLEKVYEHFPDLEQHVREVSIGSPLSSNQYLGREFGNVYGLAHSSERFDLHNREAEAVTRIRVEGVEGLYMAGQDTLFVSVTAAMFSGLATACNLSKRALWGVGPLLFGK